MQVRAWYIRGVILGDVSIGDKISQLRADQGMSRSELARRSGIMERTIGRIENGEHPACAWNIVIQILNKGLGAHLELTFREPDETGK